MQVQAIVNETSPYIKTKVLRQKLLTSHLTVAYMGVLFLIIFLVLLLGLRSKTDLLASLRGPATLKSTIALSGVRESMANIAGWIAVGDVEFRHERWKAWHNEIIPSIHELRILAKRLDNPELNMNLMEIDRNLKDLNVWQWWIEDAAQTPGNDLAHLQFVDDIEPIFDDVFLTLTTIINLEKTLPADAERKKLLSLMADLRGMHTRSFAILSELIINLDPIKEQEFHKYWEIVKLRMNELSALEYLLTDEQLDLFGYMQLKISAFEFLSIDALKFKKSERSNLAQYWMKNKAIPLAGKITDALTEMSIDQNELMQKDAALVLKMGKWFSSILVGIIIFMIYFAWIISNRNAAKITLPIKKLSEATAKMASGELKEDISVYDDDEIGQLTKSFNSMRAALTDREQKLQQQTKVLKENEKELRKTLINLQKIHDNLNQTQNQLVQSEKLASIGHLAAGIAHEINNPIGFISGNLETLTKYWANYFKIFEDVKLLRQSVINQDLKEANQITAKIENFEQDIDIAFISEDLENLLEESKAGIERIKSIVLDLRTFARQEDDGSEEINIESTIESVISIVWNEMKFKVNLKKEYEDVPLIQGSKQKLGQVFMNLLINAAHAIEDKGEVIIKTYRQGEFVCVDIKDDGNGISKEAIDKIFDPFFTTKPVGVGTGLGLSISYDIVKKNNGDIKVVSEIGKGTTFTVMLPISKKI